MVKWFNQDLGVTDECSGVFWDQQIIQDLDFDSENIFVVAGRYWSENIKQINDILADYRDVLIIVTGDEESLFDVEQLEHHNMKVWVQSPHVKNYKNVDRYIPIGCPPNTHQILFEHDGSKHLRYFFAGQNTHARRKQCIDQLKDLEGGVLVETKGFTKGLDQQKYLSNLASSVIAPCPSGAVIPDTFRVYEALEAGCVPIVDGLDSGGSSQGYWEFLFGTDHPLPVLEDWSDLPGTIDYFNDTMPLRQNKCFSWWQQYKRNLKRWLKQDIADLTRVEPVFSSPDDRITVLIPTSPIPSHPDTKIIEETIQTVRYWLPDAEILIMIDGVRSEQEGYQDYYQEYVRRLLWKCNFEYHNVIPILYPEHLHQAEMTRRTLKLVDTPQMMFVEHDTPLVVDEPIDFWSISNLIAQDKADVIRLHHESHILDSHKHLLLDDDVQYPCGAGFIRTSQWSQRPHVASTQYYRQMIDTYFSVGSRTMIEDKIHGITQQAFLERGSVGWNEHKIWIYHPNDTNIKRSYHLDGRGSDPKYDMQF